MAYWFSRILRQPPVKGGRTPVNSAFIRDVEVAVEKEIKRWGVSRSFVIATAVGFALGVEEQPDYRKVRAQDKDKKEK